MKSGVPDGAIIPPKNSVKKGAGEGAALPKGLSLFRFFLFGGLMLGAAYGSAGLYFSPIPPPNYVAPNGMHSRDWAPSVCWLPIYVSIKSGIGVQESTDGYRYQGRRGRALFASSVIVFGILIGGIMGWIGGERIRLERLRRKALRVQAAKRRNANS